MNHYFPRHNTSNGNFGFQKKLRDQLCPTSNGNFGFRKKLRDQFCPDSRILVAFNLNS